MVQSLLNMCLNDVCSLILTWTTYQSNLRSNWENEPSLNGPMIQSNGHTFRTTTAKFFWQSVSINTGNCTQLISWVMSDSYSDNYMTHKRIEPFQFWVLYPWASDPGNAFLQLESFMLWVIHFNSFLTTKQRERHHMMFLISTTKIKPQKKTNHGSS